MRASCRLAIVAAVTACGRRESAMGGEEGGSSSGSGEQAETSGDESESTDDEGPAPDLPPDCETSASGVLWFTTFADARLFSFEPDSGEVEFVDFLPCRDANDFGPYATTVDRHGTLWGYLWDIGLVRIDPETLECEDAPWEPGPNAYQVMSLGFVAEDGSEAEILYATFAEGENLAGSPHHFGTIDTVSGKPTILGPLGGPDGVDGMGTPLITLGLDGLGDGRLYGLTSGFPVDGVPWPTLYQLDRLDGGLDEVHGFEDNGSGWPVGFSWWGDDLYLIGNFWGAHGIFRWNPQTGEVTTIVEDIRTATGIESIGLVSGAGSSSCIPAPRVGD